MISAFFFDSHTRVLCAKNQGFNTNKYIGIFVLSQSLKYRQSMTYIDIMPNIRETDILVSKILDGDSISVFGIYTHKVKEIRLYGLDAPETRKSRKLREDEEKTRVAGEL